MADAFPSLSGSIENLIEYKRCIARGESETNNKSSSSVISSPKCNPTYSEPVVPVVESTKMLITSMQKQARLRFCFLRSHLKDRLSLFSIIG